jgi:ATP-dependent RNA helicase DeaD
VQDEPASLQESATPAEEEPRSTQNSQKRPHITTAQAPQAPQAPKAQAPQAQAPKAQENKPSKAETLIPSNASKDGKTEPVGSAEGKGSEGSKAEAVELSPEEHAALVKEKFLQEAQPYAKWSILSEGVREALVSLKYEKPTAVQRAAIEPALAGQDMVVQAKTGTGKTAAFGIPIVEMLAVRQGRRRPQALVIVPTRELAAQVAEEITKIGQFKGLRVAALYGGIQISQQLDELAEGVDIVVGTPGRLLDHIRRKTLKVDQIRIAVLDEADEMLSMGFYLEVSSILELCPAEKQMLMFSATIAPDLEGLVRTHLQRPLRLMISGGDRRVEGIHHVTYFEDSSLPRPRNLLYILEYEAPTSAIIFCNTREETSMIASYLLQQGKLAEAIHGEIDQQDREEALQKLKTGALQYLVATDVAARGIDISGLSHTINYNFPNSIDVYLHRAGRVGRQGRKGVALSLVSGNDLFHLTQLKRIHKIFFDTRELPPAKDIVHLAASRHLETIFRASLGHLIEPYLPLADAVSLDGRGRFIMAYLLKLYHEEKIQPVQEALRHTANGQHSTHAPAPAASKAPAPQAAKTPSSPVAQAPTPTAAQASAPVVPASATTTLPIAGTTADASEASADATEENASTHVRLYLSIGTAQGYNADALRKMLHEETNLPTALLGAIIMERHHAFLDLQNEAAEKVLAAFQERKIGEFVVNAEVARRQPRRFSR